MHLEFCILIPVFQVDNTEGLNFEAPDDRFPAYCGNTNEISACFKGYFRVNTYPASAADSSYCGPEEWTIQCLRQNGDGHSDGLMRPKVFPPRSPTDPTVSCLPFCS